MHNNQNYSKNDHFLRILPAEIFLFKYLASGNQNFVTFMLQALKNFYFQKIGFPDDSRGVPENVLGSPKMVFFPFVDKIFENLPPIFCNGAFGTNFRSFSLEILLKFFEPSTLFRDMNKFGAQISWQLSNISYIYVIWYNLRL